MQRRTLSIVLTALIIIAAAVAAWLAFSRFVPSTPPSTTGTPAGGGKPLPSDQYYAGINLYIAGPDDAPAAIGHLELTLLSAEVKRDDGKTFPIFGGGDTANATRIVVQKGVSQKALNVLMPPGSYGTLTLTFLPTGTLVAENGTTQTVFLPVRKVQVALKQDVPMSRTVTGLVRLGLDTPSFGMKSGVPTYVLPDTLSAETYLLGGIFLNSRGIGADWQLDKPTITSEVRKDLNLDITPKPSQTGTTTFTPATGQPTPAQPTTPPQ